MSALLGGLLGSLEIERLRGGVGGPSVAVMKSRLLVIATMAVASLGLAGCESLSDATSAVREKFAERAAPQTKSYPAAQRAVYDAVRTASEQMGYRFVRGGAAQGVFEAVSRVRGGDSVGTSRQLSLKVKLEPALDGGTSVAARITEIIEADSSNRAGVATETPLRDTPQYEVFFRGVEQALKAPKPGAES